MLAAIATLEAFVYTGVGRLGHKQPIDLETLSRHSVLLLLLLLLCISSFSFDTLKKWKHHVPAAQNQLNKSMIQDAP